MTRTADAHASIDELLRAEPDWDTARDFDPPHRFRSRRHRDEHVRKHVIDGRHERWHQLLDPDDLSAARSDSGDMATWERLAAAYERTLAEVLEEAIRPPRHAVRLVRFEIVPPGPGEAVIGGYRPDLRIVVAWCPRRRVRVVAGFSVSEPEAAAYRLLSGYRHDLAGTPARFSRVVRRRVLDRVRRSQERLLDPFPTESGIPAPSRPMEHG